MRFARATAAWTITAAAFLSSINFASAQSFRRGGTEFEAVRSVFVPARKTPAIIVVEFLHHGLLRPDGRNLLVAARNKDTVPYRVLQVGPGDFCRAAFQPIEGQAAYDVIYGGDPPRDDPPSWTARDGLLLETREFRRCNLRSLDSVRRAFEAAEPIGADYVEGVFHAANPCTLERKPFLSRYSGCLHLREAGTYGFFVSGRDCCFLLIDGKPVASALGRHGLRRRAVPGSRHDVRLTAGEHEFEFYHAAAGPDAVMAVAWEINPPDEKPQRPRKIPAEAFNTHMVARLPAGRVNMRIGGQAPDFSAEVVGDVPLPDNDEPLVAVKFSDLSPEGLSGRGAKIHWDFGDGQSSDLPNPEHVYLRPGLYTATLSVRRGVRTDETTNRVYVDRPQLMPGEKTHTLDQYFRIIETYDPRKLDAASLRQLALAYEAKALASPDEYEAYITKAVEVVRAALRDDAAVKGDADLLKLAKTVCPMARFILDNSPAATEIWLAAGQRQETAEAKAECEIAAADAAVNDLHRPADAKRLLDAAEGRVGKEATGFLAARLHRVRGDCLAAAGDGAAARKAYLEAEKLVGSARRLNVETAERGAHARSTEEFIRSKQYARAAEQLDAWVQEYPAERLDGYMSLLLARYWAERGKFAQSIAQAERLQTVNPDSPYVDQLLMLAADGQMRLGRKDRALAALHSLVNDYPGSPLAPLAKKNIEILEGGKLGER
ncbi:MAG: PKD domain-containing protein [Pirellulales bacterium]|nr:PKD domain-containing protein [Pirellulales bacterium]